MRAVRGSFERVFGVDFSGARLAGRTAWVAEARVLRRGARALEVVSLRSLERACGSAERGPALAWLANAIRGSERALWGIDAPFGLPIEVVPRGMDWRAQLAWIGRWPDAPSMGRALADASLAAHGVRHVRREADRAARTPFDCYHYRIVHQTFHAMRDVLLPLADDDRVAIVPFDDAGGARSVVCEACPSTTLARLGLPRRLYKQPEGGPLRADRRKNRRAILEGLRAHAIVSERDARVAMRDPGGDALDAIVAVVGVAHAFAETDLGTLPPRARREGWVFG